MRVLRDPIAAFVAAAFGVFATYALVGAPRDELRGRIEITEADLLRLRQSFEAVWLRPPDGEELQRLVEERVRDEVFYREALAMGLDRDDPVVRGRLRQAMEFRAADSAANVEPLEGELETWFRANADRYRTDSRLSFRQIVFSKERRGAAAASDASDLLERLRSGAEAASPGDLGDPSLLPREQEDVGLSEIAARFGQDFAGAVASCREGEWSGPVESPHGIHLVYLERRAGGEVPPLVEIREAVLRDWKIERARKAEEDFFAELLSRYTVRVEPVERASR